MPIPSSPTAQADLAASSGVQREMPRWRCHKIVWALKIKEVHVEDVDRMNNTSAIIVPEEEGFAPFRVDAGYVMKHTPKAGGYFVQYEDGYKSFSPAKAFEDGYKPIGDFQQRVITEKDELDGKYMALESFIGSPTFKTLNDAEQLRLTRQLGIMSQYSAVLSERIGAF